MKLFVEQIPQEKEEEVIVRCYDTQEKWVDSHDIAYGSLGSGFAAPCAPLGILVRATGCNHLCQFYSGGKNPLASD